MRVDDCVSSSLEVSTGPPQGCILSPLFYIHDCVPKHTSNTTVKFADETVVTGLIFDGDEKVYRNEVATLEQWSGGNHLCWTSRKPRRSLWTTETKGDIHSTAIVNRTVVDRVNTERLDTFKYLGANVHSDLTWACNTTTVITKAQAAPSWPQMFEEICLEAYLRNFYLGTTRTH